MPAQLLVASFSSLFFVSFSSYLSNCYRYRLAYLLQYLNHFDRAFFSILGFHLVFNYAFFEGGIVQNQDAGLGHMCEGTNFCIVLCLIKLCYYEINVLDFESCNN